MSFLTAFNKQLCNLVNNLSDMFPTDPDLQFSKNTVAFLKKNNPRKLQKIFSEYVAIYKDQIKEEDDKFFLTKDFIKEDLDFDSNHYSNDIMKNLKKYWHLMDTESKQNIWKYLKVLIILNDKCNNA